MTNPLEEILEKKAADTAMALAKGGMITGEIGGATVGAGTGLYTGAMVAPHIGLGAICTTGASKTALATSGLLAYLGGSVGMLVGGFVLGLFGLGAGVAYGLATKPDAPAKVLQQAEKLVVESPVVIKNVQALMGKLTSNLPFARA